MSSSSQSSFQSLPSAEELYKNLKNSISTYISDLPSDKVHLVGIYSGGAWLSQRLHKDLGLTTQLGSVSVTFHRDDFKRIGLHSQKQSTNLPFDVDGVHIILVDDILSSGRTVRAGINEIFDFGRPASVTLAVLLDRGSRQLPIAAQLCGGIYPLDENNNYVLTHDQNSLFEIKIEAKHA